MAVILRGAEVVNAMKDKMTQEVEALKARGIQPQLAIVRVGARPDDLSYERGAMKRCESVGVKCTVFALPEGLGQAEFNEQVKAINDDKLIHGMLLFRPFPKQISEEVVKNIVAPAKDMDGMTPINVAKVFAGDADAIPPCTPEAVMEVLDHFKISVEGKRVVVIGRSMVVGKPLSMMLLKKHATLTICHTRTKDLEGVARGAEILIAAAGKAKMVTAAFVSPGATVIDVGINVDAAGNLCGDVDFEPVEKVAGYITPVPGGVGTVTSSLLAKHVIRAASQSV
jgi:methylenetetrahydrofolate dehydrogenase (NADP+)/methenyltetrahydrofolate cyclohydrolase